eukprot:gene1754-33165_t
MGFQITSASLKQLCKELKLYSSAPELNDVLHLHCKGIAQLENLDEYTGLKALYLEQNAISEIENLKALVNLRCLYLGKNVIQHISGLEALTNLETLDLSDNYITKADGLQCLPGLRTLLMSGNKLRSAADVQPLTQCAALTSLDLASNRIEEGEAIEMLVTLPLSLLRLNGNPVVNSFRNYRRFVISSIPTLCYMDESPVFPKDRRLAEAFMKDGGGLEAERSMREQQEEVDKAEAHRQAFDAMVERAKANPPAPLDPMRFRAVPPGESDSDDEGLPANYKLHSKKKGAASKMPESGAQGSATGSAKEETEGESPATQGRGDPLLLNHQPPKEWSANEGAEGESSASTAEATAPLTELAQVAALPALSVSVELSDSVMEGEEESISADMVELSLTEEGPAPTVVPAPAPAQSGNSGHVSPETSAPRSNEDEAGGGRPGQPQGGESRTVAEGLSSLEFKSELQQRAVARAAARAETAAVLQPGSGEVNASARSVHAPVGRNPPVWGSARYRQLWDMAVRVGEQQEREQAGLGSDGDSGEDEEGVDLASTQDGVDAAAVVIPQSQGAAVIPANSLLSYGTPQARVQAPHIGGGTTATVLGAVQGADETMSQYLDRHSIADSAFNLSTEEGMRDLDSAQGIDSSGSEATSNDGEDVDSARGSRMVPGQYGRASEQHVAPEVLHSLGPGDMDSARDGVDDADLDSARHSVASYSDSESGQEELFERYSITTYGVAAGDVAGAGAAGQGSGGLGQGSDTAPPLSHVSRLGMRASTSPGESSGPSESVPFQGTETAPLDEAGAPAGQLGSTTDTRRLIAAPGSSLRLVYEDSAASFGAETEAGEQGEALYHSDHNLSLPRVDSDHNRSLTREPEPILQVSGTRQWPEPSEQDSALYHSDHNLSLPREPEPEGQGSAFYHSDHNLSLPRVDSDHNLYLPREATAVIDQSQREPRGAASGLAPHESVDHNHNSHSSSHNSDRHSSRNNHNRVHSSHNSNHNHSSGASGSGLALPSNPAGLEAEANQGDLNSVFPSGSALGCGIRSRALAAAAHEGVSTSQHEELQKSPSALLEQARALIGSPGQHMYLPSSSSLNGVSAQHAEGGGLVHSSELLAQARAVILGRASSTSISPRMSGRMPRVDSAEELITSQGPNLTPPQQAIIFWVKSSADSMKQDSEES